MNKKKRKPANEKRPAKRVAKVAAESLLAARLRKMTSAIETMRRQHNARVDELVKRKLVIAFVRIGTSATGRILRRMVRDVAPKIAVTTDSIAVADILATSVDQALRDAATAWTAVRTRPEFAHTRKGEIDI